MFASITRGWQLTKASFKVLSLDKEMLWLPILSGVITFALWLSLGVPLGLMAAAAGAPQEAMLLVLFVLYVVSYFVVVFFNTALVEMASIRFAGGDPVLKDGFRKAWSLKFRVLQWAVVAATVGLILKVLEGAARNAQNDMVRMVGQIGVWLAGAAWNIATFFVVPVIVHRDLGPVDALKLSAGTFKRTWGETATGIFTTGFVFFLLSLVGIAGIFVAITVGGVLGIVVGAFAIAWLVATWAANGAIDAILVTALYTFAETGRLPEAFTAAGAPDANELVRH